MPQAPMPEWMKIDRDEAMARLRRGNAKRLAGVKVKADLTAGRIKLEQALTHRDASHVPVYRMLMACPKVAQTKSTQALNYAAVAPQTPCGALGEASRARLLTRLSWWPSVEPHLYVRDEEETAAA